MVLKASARQRGSAGLEAGTNPANRTLNKKTGPLLHQSSGPVYRIESVSVTP